MSLRHLKMKTLPTKFMAVYLSRKYHYLLNTKNAQAMSSAKRMEAAHAVTDMQNETEDDLPIWVQRLIDETKYDPEALHSNYKGTVKNP
jgi:thiaminase